jgi:CysZ protein
MIQRFFSGMGAFGRGWRFAFSRGGLAAWTLLPALIAIIVTGLGTWGAAHFVGAWLDAHTNGRGALVGALVWVGVMLVAAAAAYVLYVASCVLATAPFAGVLSERTEKLATGGPLPPSSFGREVGLALRGIGQALLGITCYLAIAVPLFIVHWVVPALAPVVWVLSLLEAALFFAYDAFNEPLHRRGASFGAKWAFIRAHLAESLGFGTAVALVMMIPLVSVVVVPVAVIGGTLLYLELGKQSRPPT